MARVICQNCGSEVILPEKSRFAFGQTIAKETRGNYVLPMEQNNNIETQDLSEILQIRRDKLTELSDLMKNMDSAAHGESTHTERQYLFLKLILMLNEKPFTNHTATQLSDYIEKNLGKISSLSDICEAFHYSKNYIIRIFKKEFGVYPSDYREALLKSKK